MAEIAVVESQPRNLEWQGFWETVTAGDTGDQMEIPQGTDMITMSAVGTFGGRTLSLETSIDNVIWFAVPNFAGAACALTANGGVVGASWARYIRPALTAGGGGSDVDVTILCGKCE